MAESTPDLAAFVAGAGLGVSAAIIAIAALSVVSAVRRFISV